MLGYVEGSGEGALTVGSGAGHDLCQDGGGHSNLLPFIIGTRDIVEELHEGVTSVFSHADVCGSYPPARGVGTDLIVTVGLVQREIRALQTAVLALPDGGPGCYLFSVA